MNFNLIARIQNGYLHSSNKQLHFLQADLFGAGTDTSLTTVKWCVAAMAKKQHVQEEIWLEMRQALGEAASEVRLEDSAKLPKLNVSHLTFGGIYYLPLSPAVLRA